MCDRTCWYVRCLKETHVHLKETHERNPHPFKRDLKRALICVTGLVGMCDVTLGHMILQKRPIY